MSDESHDHDHRIEEAYWTAVEDQAMAALLGSADVETSTATLLGQLQAVAAARGVDAALDYAAGIAAGLAHEYRRLAAEQAEHAEQTDGAASDPRAYHDRGA